jgi:3-hydroxyacyl-[acyl-carrier-protein] dehydratase
MKRTQPILADDILKFLPHRFPMILVDRIDEIVVAGDPKELDKCSDKVGTTVRASKLISLGDPVFQGHFPGRAIFPGVMTLEALAQTACFSMYTNVEQNGHEHNIEVALLGFDGVRYRSPVIPGDVLRLETKVTKVRRKIFAFETTAHVHDKLVCEAELLAQIEFVKKR